MRGEEAISLAFLKNDVEKGNPKVGLGVNVGVSATLTNSKVRLKTKVKCKVENRNFQRKD